MMMNRRTFSAAMVAGAAASLISPRGRAATPAATKARNVVLVHGLFADGSSWSEVLARFRGRPGRSEGQGSLCGPRAVPQGPALGQDDACGLAVEAEFLCRFDGRPDDQSRSRTLHGQAHGSQDHRSEGESPVADIPTGRHQPVDPGSRRTARLAGVRPRAWTVR